MSRLPDLTKLPPYAPKVGGNIVYITLEDTVVIGQISKVMFNTVYFTITNRPIEWEGISVPPLGEHCDWCTWEKDGRWQINPRLAWGI